MKTLKRVKTNFLIGKKWLCKLSVKKKILIGLVFLAILTGLYFLFSSQQTKKIEYQTTSAQKGSLITAVSGSGTITSGTSTNITSKVSGVVKNVYVTNGDSVTKGQKIAEVTLDDYASERQTSAWASYLDAQEAVKTAQKDKVTADIAMWQARQALLDAQDNLEYKNEHDADKKGVEYTDSDRVIIDKQLDQAKLAFTEAETKYKNADSEIQLSQTKVAAALRDYHENSAVIFAPTSGVVSNLNLATGMVINSTATSNNSNALANSINAVASQTFGQVADPKGSLLATISLSEIDIIKVKANQKVTLTLDAYEDKTFTGKVLAVDTAGNVSSGVTNYKVSILLDKVGVDIYQNMAVNASIIIDIVNDVITIPTTAITTLNGVSSIQILINGQPRVVTVELGKSNDAQTAILSGLSEGDEVVTSVIDNSRKNTTNKTTTSPFSGFSSNSTTRMYRSTGVGGVMTIQAGPPGGFN